VAKYSQSIGYFNAGQVVGLWLAVVVTAISVAYVSHVCREKYAELMSLELKANQLQTDYGRYLLEQSAWGSLQRIEVSAVERFEMHSPAPDKIIIVRNSR
jgi:cell division protein FtsL